jgi:prepilin-type N-terminal cleavage/methylation domain-containing protein
LRPFVGGGRLTGHANYPVIARSEATKQSLSYNGTNRGALLPLHGSLRSARNDRRYQRAGFTLVEVIVVLVILAILAAIAIPALTGYIDKAQDKALIMEARNRVVACRAVLDDAYASGELTSPAALNGVHMGYSNIMALTIDDISEDAFDDFFEIYKRASALQGETYPPNGTFAYSIAFVTEEGSGATLLGAEGFFHQIWHESYASGPLDIVTYKMSAASVPLTTRQEFFNHCGAANGSIRYDKNAGYNVYHLVV